MARSFNGSSDVITFTGGGSATAAAASWSLWYYPNGTPAASVVGLIYTPGASGGDIKLYLNNTLDLTYFNTFGQSRSTVNTVVTANTWNHLLISGTSSTAINTYLNGSLADNGATGSASQDLSLSTLLGDDSVNNPRWFNGSMADLAIWNTNLSAGEASALAKGARPYQIRPASLVNYLPLDGLQSPEPDMSGKALNGTLTGTAKADGPPVMMFTPRVPYFLAAPPPPGPVVFLPGYGQMIYRPQDPMAWGWNP